MLSIRVLFGFVLSLITATTVTAMIIGFPFWLFPIIGLFTFLYSLKGIVCAALFLGPAFFIACLLSQYRASIVVAGGIAGFLFALAALVVSRTNIVPLRLGFTDLENVLWILGRHPPLPHTVTVGVGTTIAGLCAGWVFGRISAPTTPLFGPTDQQIYTILAVLFLSVPASYAAWTILHDRTADQLCAHTDIVRVRIGNAAYSIPSAYQPDITPADDAAEKQVNIFHANEWPGSPAARETTRNLTYCQTSRDPAWRVRSISIFSVNAKTILPFYVIDVGIFQGDTNKYLDRLQARSIPISLPHDDPDFWFIPSDGQAWSSFPGFLRVQLNDGSRLSVTYVKEAGRSDADVLRQTGRLLRTLQSRID